MLWRRLFWRRLSRQIFAQSRVSRRTRRSPRSRLGIEALEARVVPSTFTVNALTDTGAGSGNSGDLLYCINQANTSGGTINFSPLLANQTIDLTQTTAYPNGFAFPAGP